jgi:hypothetical protein
MRSVTLKALTEDIEFSEVVSARSRRGLRAPQESCSRFAIRLSFPIIPLVSEPEQASKRLDL